MLINPLDKKMTVMTNQNVNSQDVVGEIISYLIQNYSEYLSDITINQEMVEKIVREKVYQEYASMNTESTIKKILDKLFGYDILQKYIDDENVSDIRVTRFDQIFIKKKGKWENAKESFPNEDAFVNFVRYCVLKNKGKITQEVPIITVADRVNNLRIEAGIEPVNVSSPNLVIRIHRPQNTFSLEELFMTPVEMFDYPIYRFLVEAMIAGCNIVISGKGGSGKTTLMRNLINRIPEELSITANEETAELYCSHPNMIEREVISSRADDKNVTLETLMAHSLVMSNDVIVVGELKGAEAMSFFDAIATGHRGYATVHADSSMTTIDRLVTLMKRDYKAQMYSNQYLRKMLSMSVDLIIFMKDFKIQEISEVLYDVEKDDVSYNPLFSFSYEKDELGQIKERFCSLGEPKGNAFEKINQYRMKSKMKSA